ncbi:MAG: hypothetical protein IPG92_13095 [Flavobacteriales bacterium]|nr:hypothetical protein [Flavobacteriales bacterium]
MVLWLRIRLRAISGSSRWNCSTSAGEALAEGNHLQWTTGSETGSDHFTVERSNDGLRFAPVGEVTAMGNSQRATAYNFMDRSAPDGISFYRLRMVDLECERGSIQRYRCGALHERAHHLPEPSERSHHLDPFRWCGAAVSMMRREGAFTKRLSPASRLPASIAELPNGHYSLELLDAQGMPLARGRFIKAQAPIAP